MVVTLESARNLFAGEGLCKLFGNIRLNLGYVGPKAAHAAVYSSPPLLCSIPPILLSLWRKSLVSKFCAESTTHKLGDVFNPHHSVLGKLDKKVSLKLLLLLTGRTKAKGNVVGEEQLSFKHWLNAASKL